MCPREWEYVIYSSPSFTNQASVIKMEEDLVGQNKSTTFALGKN